MNSKLLSKIINSFAPSPNYLHDRTILISATSDGIGAALAESCANLGASVIAISRNSKINSENDNIHYYEYDYKFSSEDDYYNLLNTIINDNKKLDSLVLTAGSLHGLQGLKNLPSTIWSEAITENLHSLFLLYKACIPHLENSTDPSIVFSTHDCNKAYWGAYGVAKAAQLGMMKILACELVGDKPIRVNGVDPSPVRTKLRLTNFPGINPEEFAAPEEVLAPYLYFIGPDSKGVTGINYKLNPDFSG